MSQHGAVPLPCHLLQTGRLEVTRPHAELSFGVGVTPRGTLQSVTYRVPAWAALFWAGGDLCGDFGDAAASWWLQPGEAFLQQDLFP